MNDSTLSRLTPPCYDWFHLSNDWIHPVNDLFQPMNSTKGMMPPYTWLIPYSKCQCPHKPDWFRPKKDWFNPINDWLNPIGDWFHPINDSNLFRPIAELQISQQSIHWLKIWRCSIVAWLFGWLVVVVVTLTTVLMLLWPLKILTTKANIHELVLLCRVGYKRGYLFFFFFLMLTNVFITF